MNTKVELAGFREIDSSSMDIINKDINHHVQKLAGRCSNLEKLHITLKKIHEREKGEKYEIKAKLLDNGKAYVSHSTERNIFTAIDLALEKLMHELGIK